MDHTPVPGEWVTVPERVIVAPTVGIFRPTNTQGASSRVAMGTFDEAVEVRQGEQIGVIEGPGAAAPVTSPFEGRLLSLLAHPGERVREGQPVAWLRIA